MKKIFSVSVVASHLLLLGTLSGLEACTGTATVQAEAPAPGLVAVGPDVWVVGDADAPDAYYSDGYYWRQDGDHWARRPSPNVEWVVVETRVVPERVVVHERDHHAAIAARPKPGLTREQIAQQSQEKKAAVATEHREEVQDRREQTAVDEKERQKVDIERARAAEHRDIAAERKEQATERREKTEEQREKARESKTDEPKH